MPAKILILGGYGNAGFLTADYLLQETGFFVSGFNKFTDMVAMPICYLYQFLKRLSDVLYHGTLNQAWRFPIKLGMTLAVRHSFQDWL